MVNFNDPEAKPIIQTVGYGTKVSDKTNAEITLEPLTDEVLRDIACNESCSRPWRKAAIKFLIKRNHRYQSHPSLVELLTEIKEEQEAETEVKSIVESAIERSISED